MKLKARRASVSELVMIAMMAQARPSLLAGRLLLTRRMAPRVTMVKHSKV